MMMTDNENKILFHLLAVYGIKCLHARDFCNWPITLQSRIVPLPQKSNHISFPHQEKGCSIKAINM